jgi:integrase-like protein
VRVQLPVGPLFCILTGPTRGCQWSGAAAREELRKTAVAAGIRRRFASHQLRHAHAVEMAHEGVPLIVIQRQLGHSNLGITSVYLQGIDNAEIIDTVHARRAPMIPVSTSVTALINLRVAALLVARSASEGRCLVIADRRSPAYAGKGDRRAVLRSPCRPKGASRRDSARARCLNGCRRRVPGAYRPRHIADRGRHVSRSAAASGHSMRVLGRGHVRRAFPDESGRAQRRDIWRASDDALNAGARAHLVCRGP